MRPISDYIAAAVIVAAVGLITTVIFALCRAAAEDFTEDTDNEEYK